MLAFWADFHRSTANQFFPGLFLPKHPSGQSTCGWHLMSALRFCPHLLRKCNLLRKLLSEKYKLLAHVTHEHLSAQLSAVLLCTTIIQRYVALVQTKISLFLEWRKALNFTGTESHHGQHQQSRRHCSLSDSSVVVLRFWWNLCS